MQRDLRVWVFGVLALALSLPVFGQSSSATSATPQTARKADAWGHFESLVKTINDARADLLIARRQLQGAQDDTEAEQLRKEVTRLSNEIESLQLAWEMWATGGVDMQLFSTKTTEKFDWREEIESVFEPIVVELRRLTERPRKMERLRSEQAFFQERLTAAEAAHKNVAELKTQAPTDDLVAAFSSLEERWRKRRDDLRTRLDLVSYELRELQAPSQPGEVKAKEALKELLSGRLVNLLLALTAAGATYALLRLISRGYVSFSARRGKRRSTFSRAINLAFLTVAVVLSLFAAMGVLYAKGDWILLGLLLIVLVGVALTLQRTLPGYIKEAKILLNIGPVREGERVMYGGLPWKVASLNMYSTLINPALRGGRIRLPVSDLQSLISRRFDENEPWFPSRENDFVLLDDDTFGKVLLQTPETVQLRVAGAVRSYPIDTFVGKCPQNLSREGFAVALKFGVDYALQSNVTKSIRESLESAVGARLKEHEVGKYVQEFFVEFDEAAASSLDFLVYALFTGDAAPHYRRIRRLMQSLAVDACNANNWVIPFSQVTVHMASGDEKAA